MDLSTYRLQPSEQARREDLLRLLPSSFSSALDVGARDGYFSRLLAQRAAVRVVALDLQKPSIEYPRVENAAGDITRLAFPDNAFDVVLCAEVLEHVPDLQTACRELARVTAKALLIGVPYRQDTRIGRCLCANCGRLSPPYGHVNVFDEARLRALFAGMREKELSLVWTNRDATNAVAVKLMDWAGNPFGTYDQDEPCIHCGHAFVPPGPLRFSQKLLARLATSLNRWEERRKPPQANWIHMLWEKV
jgi:SAM-dependent methyltransferase